MAHDRKKTAIAGLALCCGLVGSVGAPATAQTSPRPAPALARLDSRAGIIQGKLSRVDGQHETVDVSIGFLGLLGKTLEVNRDTLIQVNGRAAQFADLQEGAKVKAFYEERGARLVATRLEVSTV
ncbi:MAG TPA: hypothetical protein VN323_22210 [Candidatus Dormibacteraeota bacterium]|jgi:hypothetical protein|nr:hypothetical protein [Candidatus Dormibacteraeota bacterium]